MNRIDEAFLSLPDKGVLIGYLTAGFPDVETSLSIGSALLKHCDILELGIPFSDPVMDGPLIQESSRRALEAGIKIEGVLDMAQQLRSRTDKPLLIMTYYNPVHRHGPSAFAAGVARAGIDGVLIPDLPPEEMSQWEDAASDEGLCTVLFASLTTPDERLRYLGRQTQGFLYCIAVKGTTGLRDHLSGDLEEFMRRVRSCCDVPLALGIGISNAEQCRSAARLADAVVVGSALVKCAMEALDEGDDPARRSSELAGRLKEALLQPGV
jgi:tryptophan synthase alpha chain